MPEFTKEDLQNSIINPKFTKSTSNISETAKLFYDENGISHEKPKGKFGVCATLSKAGKNTIYRAMIGRGNKLYNPLKNSVTYGLTVPSRTSNDAMFTLREVNSVAFNSYIKFLETRYDSYLSTAEREI